MKSDGQSGLARSSPAGEIPASPTICRANNSEEVCMLQQMESPMETPKQNPSRFDYVRYDDDSVKLQEIIKHEFQKVEEAISCLAEGRAKSLILTHLEIAYMWCGKAIRDNQIARIGSPNVPERSNQ